MPSADLPSGEPMIVFDGVEKRFGDNVVLSELNFTVAPGEHVCLIGPSGSGKTTILRLLMTLEKVDRGSISVGGKSLSHMEKGGKLVPADDKHCREVRKHIGMVFQQFNLFPNMTVRGNLIEAPTRVLGLSKEEATARAQELLDLVGLNVSAERQAGTLSHGDQKKLELAVALAGKPRLLLLDEPTAGMAANERLDSIRTVHRIAKQLGLTVVFTEHDMQVVFSVADRISVLHQGAIIADDAPEAIRRSPQVQQVYLGETVDEGAP